MNIDIFTINMSGNHGSVAERYGELSEYMLETRPDIITAQEVSADVGIMALEGIAQQLGNEYNLSKGRNGLAVVSRLPVTTSKSIDFSVPGKKAQVVELIKDDGESLVVSNVHLDARPSKEKIRKIKLRELIHAIAIDFPELPKIIAGDFNALPFFPSLRVLPRNGYSLVTMPKNSNEPFFTFPSSLTADELVHQGYMREDEVRMLQRVGKIPGIKSSPYSGLPKYIIDYIFLSRGIRTISSAIIERTCAESPPISDHCGIQASLKIG